MTNLLSHPCTAFRGHEKLHSGPGLETALAVKRAVEAGTGEPILVFDDVSGRVVDFDLRGSDAEIAARLETPPASRRGRFRSADDVPPDPDTAKRPRGRGRPKLGVVSREVTLLPRHWDWLSDQPGGASAALRRLVEEARRTPDAGARRRAAQGAAYAFMQAIAGDLPGFEEATRALFAGDRPTFEQQMADWPRDLRAHALRLAFDGTSSQPDDSGASR